MAFEYNVSPATSKALVSAIGLGVKAENAHVAAAELLYAEGVRVATMEDTAWRTEFVADVISKTFSATDWAIWTKPSKALPELEKTHKSLIKRKIDRRYKTVMKYVRDTEYNETLDDDTRQARQTTTFEARLRKSLDGWIKKIQNRESLYFDGTKCVQHLKAALEVVNKG